MPRYLPVLVVQEPSRRSGRDTELRELEAELSVHLSDFGAEFEQTRMVVYPEFYLCGASGTPAERRAQLEAAAEPIDGPRHRHLARIARNQGVWLLPGTVCERGEDGHLYNTAPVYSPQGERVAAYRKCFPWRPYEPFQPGSRLETFDIPGIGRIGLAICYDIWFPEVVRQLAWSGAEVIINQVATSTSDRAQELILVQANAIFNQVYMVSANAAKPTGEGQSLMVDPEGRVRGQMPGATSGVLTDVLNLDEVERVRTFGTAGLNRLWSQYRDDDPVLELPMYGGGIDPRKWNQRG
ncbi:carbon-nitrogen hydrolase family protein [Halomonas icarae]|uniref:Carbon-nitrogen hydrolase family protein n=1 Tax=Halomonas icarae TaxID=2691040 RepID=A0A7X4VW89_9GAMM|nr:carbon-nitrogen hydrolase family protein [Halomonas icarae]MDR5901192.1 carbon-nitrogen hydrolase family protein [Halomonas icarae]NAW11469.1 carbon-nitrogen hydrolase family protein [Halomonas icarae]